MTSPVVPGTVLVDIDEGGGSRPDVVWLDNSVLRLGFVPAFGGRLLSVRLRGRETLWRNETLLDENLHPRDGHHPAPTSGPMSNWNNYGGDKTWPAPQGWSAPTEWAGPPDPVLDSGSYAWSVERADDSVTLTMTSGHDPRTGLTIRRAMTVHEGSSFYDVHLEALNTSTTPVRWALWNVTQRTGGEPGGDATSRDGVDVGVEPGDHRGIPLVAGTGVPYFVIAADNRVRVPHQDVVGKVGFPGASGWLAHTSHGVTATQACVIDPAGDYPDGGSRVEIWMEHPLPEPITHLGDLHPRARIVEIELLGPSTTLMPDQRTSLDYRSGVTDGRSNVETLTPVGHWETGNRFGAYVSGDVLVDGELAARVVSGTSTTIGGRSPGLPVTLRERSGVEHDLGEENRT